MPEQFLHGVEIVEIDSGPRPIRTVRSSVIGLVGTAPKGPVNTPVLIAGSRREAALAFGTGLGTIPWALDAIFDQAGALVVVINVLDTAVHKVAVAATSFAFDGAGAIVLPHRYVRNVVVAGPVIASMAFSAAGTIALPSGATSIQVQSADGATTYTSPDDFTLAGALVTRVEGGDIAAEATVRVSYAYALAAGTDYTVDFDAGRLVLVAGGGIVAGATVSVAYDRPDPDAVDLADIVGGVDPATGAYRGVQALLAAQSVVKVTPRILLAPGFTHRKPEGFANPVVAEMLGIAGRLRAVIVADGPNASDAAAIGYREDWGSPRVYVIDPWVRVLDASGALADQPASPRVAGLIAGSDNDRGFWWSPSNQTINGIVGTSRPIDFVLGDANARANLLNENEVATIVHQDGYRLWGNRTCSSDPKWAFLSVRRTADMINESLQQAHLWAVDRNITRTYLEDVTEGVSAYLRRLQAQGAILGGRCWPDPDLNTPESIADGQVYFDFDFTPPYPAEHITFRSHLVNDYITEILK